MDMYDIDLNETTIYSMTATALHGHILPSLATPEGVVKRLGHAIRMSGTFNETRDIFMKGMRYQADPGYCNQGELTQPEEIITVTVNDGRTDRFNGPLAGRYQFPVSVPCNYKNPRVLVRDFHISEGGTSVVRVAAFDPLFAYLTVKFESTNGTFVPAEGFDSASMVITGGPANMVELRVRTLSMKTPQPLVVFTPDAGTNHLDDTSSILVTVSNDANLTVSREVALTIAEVDDAMLLTPTETASFPEDEYLPVLSLFDLSNYDDKPNQVMNERLFIEMFLSEGFFKITSPLPYVTFDPISSLIRVEGTMAEIQAAFTELSVKQIMGYHGEFTISARAGRMDYEAEKTVARTVVIDSIVGVNAYVNFARELPTVPRGGYIGLPTMSVVNPDLVTPDSIIDLNIAPKYSSVKLSTGLIVAEALQVSTSQDTAIHFGGPHALTAVGTDMTLYVSKPGELHDSITLIEVKKSVIESIEIGVCSRAWLRVRATTILDNTPAVPAINLHLLNGGQQWNETYASKLCPNLGCTKSWELDPSKDATLFNSEVPIATSEPLAANEPYPWIEFDITNALQDLPDTPYLSATFALLAANNTDSPIQLEHHNTLSPPYVHLVCPGPDSSSTRLTGSAAGVRSVLDSVELHMNDLPYYNGMEEEEVIVNIVNAELSPSQMFILPVALPADTDALIDGPESVVSGTEVTLTVSGSNIPAGMIIMVNYPDGSQHNHTTTPVAMTPELVGMYIVQGFDGDLAVPLAFSFRATVGPLDPSRFTLRSMQTNALDSSVTIYAETFQDTFGNRRTPPVIDDVIIQSSLGEALYFKRGKTRSYKIQANEEAFDYLEWSTTVRELGTHTVNVTIGGVSVFTSFEVVPLPAEASTCQAVISCGGDGQDACVAGDFMSMELIMTDKYGNALPVQPNTMLRTQVDARLARGKVPFRITSIDGNQTSSIDILMASSAYHNIDLIPSLFSVPLQRWIDINSCTFREVQVTGLACYEDTTFFQRMSDLKIQATLDYADVQVCGTDYYGNMCQFAGDMTGSQIEPLSQPDSLTLLGAPPVTVASTQTAYAPSKNRCQLISAMSNVPGTFDWKIVVDGSQWDHAITTTVFTSAPAGPLTTVSGPPLDEPQWEDALSWLFVEAVDINGYPHMEGGAEMVIHSWDTCADVIDNNDGTYIVFPLMANTELNRTSDSVLLSSARGTKTEITSFTLQHKFKPFYGLNEEDIFQCDIYVPKDGYNGIAHRYYSAPVGEELIYVFIPSDPMDYPQTDWVGPSSSMRISLEMEDTGEFTVGTTKDHVKGYCGCGVPEVDTDGDGVPDCADDCPYDSLKIEAGSRGCGFFDLDSKGSGIYDCNDYGTGECQTGPLVLPDYNSDICRIFAEYIVVPTKLGTGIVKLHDTADNMMELDSNSFKIELYEGLPSPGGIKYPYDSLPAFELFNEVSGYIEMRDLFGNPYNVDFLPAGTDPLSVYAEFTSGDIVHGSIYPIPDTFYYKWSFYGLRSGDVDVYVKYGFLIVGTGKPYVIHVQNEPAIPQAHARIDLVSEPIVEITLSAIDSEPQPLSPVIVSLPQSATIIDIAANFTITEADLPYYANQTWDFQMIAADASCGEEVFYWAAYDGVDVSEPIAIYLDSPSFNRAFGSANLTRDLDCRGFQMATTELVADFTLNGNGHHVYLDSNDPLWRDADNYALTVNNINIDAEMKCDGSLYCTPILGVTSKLGSLTVNNSTINSVINPVRLPSVALVSGVAAKVLGSISIANSSVTVECDAMYIGCAGVVMELRGANVNIEGLSVDFNMTTGLGGAGFAYMIKTATMNVYDLSVRATFSENVLNSAYAGVVATADKLTFNGDHLSINATSPKSLSCWEGLFAFLIIMLL